MEKRKDNLINNIGYLMNAYKETQMDLAYSIGLNSPNSISNYLNGTRYPKKEIREKIARHYHITEEKLMYSDFVGLDFDVDQLTDAERMKEMSLILYPIVCTEKALEDSYFKTGYEAHMRAIDAMKNGKEYSEEDYDICINSYAESYDKNSTPESIANILWWYLIIEMANKKQKLLEGVKALNQKKIKNKEFLKIYHLEDCSEDLETDMLETDDKGDLRELDETIINLIKELKQYIDFSPLADYYIALRYVSECVFNDLTEAMNKSIGEEMMSVLVRLGNEYAIKYLEVGRNNQKK